jgi:hypothetical protein
MDPKASSAQKNAKDQRDILHAQTEFIKRSSPGSKHSVYPWNNHDYQYTNYVKKHFNPEQMGISDAPCVSTFFNDIYAFKDMISKGLIFGAIPSAQSNSDTTNLAAGAPSGLADIKQKYKDFGEPYPGFSKEYPEYFPHMIQGKHASSYFIKTGNCPAPSIKDPDTCKKRGFEWVDNKVAMSPKQKKFYPNQTPAPEEEIAPASHCFKPRYSYVDNKPGDISGVFEGIIPTLSKEMLSLNPVSFMNILMSGASPFGDFKQLPCREGFQNSDPSPIVQPSIVIFLILVILSAIKYFTSTGSNV